MPSLHNQLCSLYEPVVGRYLLWDVTLYHRCHTAAWCQRILCRVSQEWTWGKIGIQNTVHINGRIVGRLFCGPQQSFGWPLDILCPRQVLTTDSDMSHVRSFIIGKGGATIRWVLIGSRTSYWLLSLYRLRFVSQSTCCKSKGQGDQVQHLTVWRDLSIKTLLFGRQMSETSGATLSILKAAQGRPSIAALNARQCKIVSLCWPCCGTVVPRHLLCNVLQCSEDCVDCVACLVLSSHSPTIWQG